MNKRGFTLVEMLVVIAIIGIILSIAIPQYGLMMRRRGMEKQMREIQSDISSFRLSAIHQKDSRRILLGPNQLQFQRIVNPNVTPPAWGTAVIPTGITLPPAKVLTYGIQKLDGTQFNINNDVIEFNERGYTGVNNVTIVVTPVDTSIGDGCIVVSSTRNNLGRMTNATTCQVH